MSNSNRVAMGMRTEVRDGTISLRNVERVGTEVFIGKLASAGIDNFQASVSHLFAGFDDTCCLAVKAANTWHLSMRLLHLLANCTDEAMRKRVYVAWRSYIASFEVSYAAEAYSVSRRFSLILVA